MKIRCSSTDFARAVRRASKAALAGRAQAWVVGESDNVEIVVQAREHVVRVAFTGEVLNDGYSPISLQPLLQWLTKTSKSVLELEGRRDVLQLSDKQGQLELTRRADQDVQIPTHKSPPASSRILRLAQGPLRDCIQQVQSSVSVDPSRGALTGILWNVSARVLELSSTDSYRLSVARFGHTSSDLVGSQKYLLPSSPMRSLANLLEPSQDEIAQVFADQGRLVVRLGDSLTDDRPIVSVETHTMPDPFPDYAALFPRTRKKTVQVRRVALLQALKRVALSRTPQPVIFTLGTDLLEISSENEDVGRATQRLDVSYSGAPRRSAYNAQFLLDGVSAARGAMLELSVPSGNRPMVLTDDTASYQHLLMPLRMDSANLEEGPE